MFYMTNSVTGQMRKLCKRLTKLEDGRKRKALTSASSRYDVERVALSKLSAADRDLLQSLKPANWADIEDQGLANRWGAALSEAWGEVGVSCIFLSAEERGW